jgi:glutamyl-tRNA reductase
MGFDLAQTFAAKLVEHPLRMGNPPSIDSTRHEELDRALRLLRRGDDPARIVDELSRRLTNKLLHAPTKALHEALFLLRQL